MPGSGGGDAGRDDVGQGHVGRGYVWKGKVVEDDRLRRRWIGRDPAVGIGGDLFERDRWHRRDDQAGWDRGWDGCGSRLAVPYGRGGGRRPGSVLDPDRYQRQRLRSGEELGGGEEGDLELRGIWAVGGIEPKRPFERSAEWADRSRRVRVQHHVTAGSQGERRRGGVAEGRHPASDRLDHHQGEGVHVRGPVQPSAEGCFGRRVPGRAPEAAARLGPRCLGENACDTEVREAWPTVVVEQQVGRLDVAMDQPATVREGERAGARQANFESLGRRQTHSVIDHRPETPARQVLRDQERHHLVGLSVFTPVEHRHDVRVLEGAGDSCLGLELAKERLVLPGRVEDLDRDLALLLGVNGEVDAL